MIATKQIEVLSTYSKNFNSQKLVKSGITATNLEIFQVNIGKLCNQACLHCHVEAGPTRTENMEKHTIEKCLEVIRHTPSIKTVDITGGAPEMNAHFVYFVEEIKKTGKHIIDRCNLTILEEPGYEHLYDFLSKHKIEVVASLPHYAQSTTDSQRGRGVFDKSIIALQKLNKLGYGSNLPLNLVYNPNGFFLSGNQEELEQEFKHRLSENFDISFNNLYCINNLPVSRFLEALVRKNKFEDYMNTLANAYNPSTVEGLMCRNQISVGYDGKVYDCDFNQMLEIPAESFAHIDDFDLQNFLSRKIAVHNHCYGCTAGSGSSCGGSIS